MDALSLEREDRIAFLLGAVFEFSGDEAAAILEIEPAAYRKRLSRAREKIASWMARRCGLVNEAAPCRCTKIVPVAQQVGFLDPKSLLWTAHPARDRDAQTRARVAEIADLHEKAIAIQRDHPDYRASDELVARVRELLRTSGHRVLH